jgi:hypothetical protein
MRTVAHLSDPYFGRLERATVQALIATVTKARPDIAVVSGDLTQRAKEREFQEARPFLEALPSPQIVVPGNHDVHCTNPSFCSANQSGFLTMEKPPIEDDAAREPRACQENSGEGTHQPRWKMTADAESPFFLHFSESLGEQVAVCF